MERILRVNLSTGESRIEPLPEAYRLLGGRAITSRIVFDEVDPLCDPLGPYNKLVWAPGLLSGTVISSTSRISVGCKSPLTGGIKESNAGGQTGLRLAQAGFRAMIVEGVAHEWSLLEVDEDGARVVPCPPEVHADRSSYGVAKQLFERYGGTRQCALAVCGITGVQLMGIAGIGNTDREGRPARMNARGAVGAVMGSKRLRAVVFKGDERKPVAAFDPAGWKSNAAEYLKGLREHPSTAKRYPELGTAAVLEVVNALGALPTRNFSAGQYEQADQISGARMREIILERGGEGMTTHACMTGCAIRCSNVFADESGKEVASSMEFETNGLMGSNLGIGSLDHIARMTFLCNDLGCDTIETGGALGVAMEGGMLRWGDAEACFRLLDEDVRQGTPAGKIIGAGAGMAGKVLGVRRVPVVKNQTISAYDPRGIKGNGVIYCTTAMGADHTAGNTIALKTDHLNPKNKVAESRDMQVKAGILDILGYCNFARGLFDTVRLSFVGMFNARMGTEIAWEDLENLTVEMMRLELEFNRRAGQPVVERLPEWMLEEPLKPHDAVFDVPIEEMEKIWAQA